MEKTITYHKWLELQNYKPASIRSLISLVHQAQTYLKRHGLNLTSEQLKSYANWVQNQGYSLVYQKHLYWGVRNYCKYLKQVQGMEIKAYLPKIKSMYKRRAALSKQDLQRIKKWLQKQQKDYWLNQTLWSLFYGCGLRRTEALNLKLTDLQISQKLLQVQTLKSGGKRSLPLSVHQLKAICNYIKKERPRPKKGYESKLLLGKRGGSAKSMLGKQLKQWQNSLEIPHLCWHVLRHSIATELVKKGMKLEKVSRFLGHKCIESTSRYLHQKPTKDEL